MTPWGNPVSRAPFGAGRRGLFEPPNVPPAWMKGALALNDLVCRCC